MNNDAPDLFEQLARIGDLLRRYHHRNHRRHGPMGDPHRGQGRVLALLKMRPEISQKELSYLLDIRQQSLGELLAKLERNGYIERTVSETDRRVMNIRLTEEGAGAAERRLDARQLFRSLSREEQETLGDYLDRIIAELEQELADFPPDEPEHGPHGECHRHRHPPHHEGRQDFPEGERRGCRFPHGRRHGGHSDEGHQGRRCRARHEESHRWHEHDMENPHGGHERCEPHGPRANLHDGCDA